MKGGNDNFKKEVYEVRGEVKGKYAFSNKHSLHVRRRDLQERRQASDGYEDKHKDTLPCIP